MGIKMKLRGLFASALLALTMAAPTQSHAVSNALFLALDGSGSINSGDWTLQVNGTVTALNNVFATNNYWGTAIGALQFSSGTSIISNISVINNAADLTALTNAISAEVQISGGTQIGNAINVAAAQITALEGSLGPISNKVIDVSTDGISADNAAAAANAVLASDNIKTNCLGVASFGDPTRTDCSFATGPIAIVIGSFNEYAATLESKLIAELNVPEPSITALLGMGLLVMGFVRRRAA